MDHKEISFLGEEGFVGRACGGVEDEFVEGCCREARRCKEDRERLGEIDVPEEGIKEGLEELLETLLNVRVNDLVTIFCAHSGVRVLWYGMPHLPYHVLHLRPSSLALLPQPFVSRPFSPPSKPLCSLVPPA